MKKLILLSIFGVATSGLFAQQQGWWTWMKGTYPGTPVINWGTQGVPAATNEPPGEYQSAACWADSKGIFWQFSGGNGWGYPTLWKYDPATNMWTWVKGANVLATTNGGVWGTQGVANIANCPPALTIGAVTWVDTNDNLWLFGGFGWGTTGTFRSKLAALWRYDPLTNMWTWMKGPNTGNNPTGVYGTQGVPSAANYPSARYETNAGWTDNSGDLWLFGGQGPSGELNDLWKYNIATNQWAWMKGSNAGGSPGNYGTKGVAAPTNNPPARQVHSRWKDNNGNFWFFGGTAPSNTNAMNDMWKFDPTTNNWTWMSGTNQLNQMPALPTTCVPSTTNYPQARRENNSTWKDACGNLWMFCGDWISGTQVNDMWCYKIQTNEWVLVKANAAASAGTKGVPAATNYPPATKGYAAWTRNNNEFWMFGGKSSTETNALWRYYPDTTCAQSTCSQAIPVAGFSGTNLTGCEDLTVTFTDTSKSANSWSWNFGDGGTSTAQNPVHTYTAAGTYTVTQIAFNGANSDTVIQPNYITVYPSATAAFTASSTTVCVGQAATFTNSSTNATSYTWNFGDGGSSAATNPTHTYTSTGTYTVSLIAITSNGCNDTINQPITVLSSSVTSTFSQSPNGCAPVTINFTNTSLGATGYVWNFGNGQTATTTTASATYTASGTYSVSLIAFTNSSCGVASDTSYSTVTVGQGATLNIIPTNVLCFGGNTGSASVSATGGSTPLTYLWSNGQSTPVISGLTNGSYSVIVTDALGCTSVQTTSISQPTVLTSSVSNTPSSCIVNNGTATVSASGGTNPFTYLWNNSQAGQTATGLGAGNYSITVTDGNGCTTISTTNIVTNNGPTALANGSTSIQIGNSATLTASGGATYSWTPTTGLNNSTIANPVASPSVTTKYCVYVFDVNGCYDSACVIITVTPEPIVCGEFYIPNAFSPNGDFENDIFTAYINPICLLEYKLIIYNRWGENIFETTDINQGWDGKLRGELSNSAVYAFYCKAKLINGKEFFKEGNVSLVR